jgi:hypothetical protein
MGQKHIFTRRSRLFRHEDLSFNQVLPRVTGCSLTAFVAYIRYLAHITACGHPRSVPRLRRLCSSATPQGIFTASSEAEKPLSKFLDSNPSLLPQELRDRNSPCFQDLHSWPNVSPRALPSRFGRAASILRCWTASKKNEARSHLWR